MSVSTPIPQNAFNSFMDMAAIPAFEQEKEAVIKEVQVCNVVRRENINAAPVDAERRTSFSAPFCIGGGACI